MARCAKLLLILAVIINVLSAQPTETETDDILDLTYYGLEETEGSSSDQSMIQTVLEEEYEEEEDSSELEDENGLLESEDSSDSTVSGPRDRPQWHDKPRRRQGRRQHNSGSHDAEGRNGRGRNGNRKGKHGHGRGHGRKHHRHHEEGSSESENPHHGAAPVSAQLHRKIKKVIHKHEKMSHKVFKDVDKSHSILCSLPGNLLHMENEELDKLSEPFRGWFEQWRGWKAEVNACCVLGNDTDVAECIVSVGTLSFTWEPSAEDELEKVEHICEKLSEAEQPNQRRSRRMMKRKQKTGMPFSEQECQERREAMMDCCQLTNTTNRLECVDDIRADKVDALCSLAEQSEQLRGKAYYLTDRCCHLEDGERYECFKASHQLKKFARSQRKQKGNKMPGKKQNKRSGDLAECCEQGELSGENVPREDRWTVCQQAGEAYVQSQTQLDEKKTNQCMKKLRRCCVRSSRNRRKTNKPATRQSRQGRRGRNN